MVDAEAVDAVSVVVVQLLLLRLFERLFLRQQFCGSQNSRFVTIDDEGSDLMGADFIKSRSRLPQGQSSRESMSQSER